MYNATTKWVAILAIVGSIAGCNSETGTTTDKAKVDKGSFTDSNLCRAAISLAMSRHLSIIKFDGVRGNEINVHYVRPDDNSRWSQRCKLDKDKIIWATKTGRWRTHERDFILKFKVKGENLTVKATYPDGSVRSEKFHKSEF